MKKLMVGIGIFTLVSGSLVFADGFSTSNAPKYDPKVTYACPPFPMGPSGTYTSCL